MAKINRDDIDRFHEYDIHVPTRTIYIGSVTVDEYESGVDAKLAERVIKNLNVLDSQQSEPINIILNNSGGDWYHGMAIYDAIKECKSQVHIKVMGQCQSMAAVILQAGDLRLISPNSRIMIHYGETATEGHSKTVQKIANEYKLVDQVMEQIFLQKILMKQPDYTLKRLKHLLDHDTFLSSQQALDLGLVDEIVTQPVNNT